MTGRQGRRLKQLMDDLKEARGNWKFKEETRSRTMWRTGFGRGCGHAGRMTTEGMNDRKRYGDASFAANIFELQSLHVTGNYSYGKQKMFSSRFVSSVCCYI